MKLDRRSNLIEGFWPKTLPAFKANCRLCIDKNGSRAYNPDARRKDFADRFALAADHHHLRPVWHPAVGNTSPR